MNGREFVKRLMPLFLIMSSLHPLSASGENPTFFRLEGVIPLPETKGRIDHMDVDVEGQRLFVAALGNSSLEVLDLKADKAVHSVIGLNEPQGVLYIHGLNKIFVTNGGNGRCDVLDGRSLKPLTTIQFSGDADNIRYYTSDKKLYVGYGNGAIGVIDALGERRIGDIGLKGHPESFQLETPGSRIFVNVPEAGHIAVIDRNKETVVATLSAA